MTTNTVYLHSLVQAFGLQKMPEAVRNSILEEIDVLVFRAVLFKVMALLDEEDKEELHDVLSHAGDDFEKPYSLLKTKIKNLDSIIKEEIEKVKEESKNIIEMVGY